MSNLRIISVDKTGHKWLRFALSSLSLAWRVWERKYFTRHSVAKRLRFYWLKLKKNYFLNKSYIKIKSSEGLWFFTVTRWQKRSFSAIDARYDVAYCKFDVEFYVLTSSVRPRVRSFWLLNDRSNISATCRSIRYTHTLNYKKDDYQDRSRRWKSAAIKCSTWCLYNWTRLASSKYVRKSFRGIAIEPWQCS